MLSKAARSRQQREDKVTRLLERSQNLKKFQKAGNNNASFGVVKNFTVDRETIAGTSEYDLLDPKSFT